MGKHFKVIYVKRGLEDRPEVRTLLDSDSEADVVAFDRVSEIVVRGNSMADKIEQGKHTLVVTTRSGSMIDQFINHDPGAVCPAFHKLVPGTNCVYDCEYCFLQATYRACRPFVCAYVMDFDRLGQELRRRFTDENGTILLNAGEMSDPIACDPLGNMPWLVTLFGNMGNVKLLLLTKSGHAEITPLLDAPHDGNTVMAWSINCPEMIEKHEHGAAFLEERLKAARAAQDAGYEVRFRLDPMLVFPGWREAYGEAVAAVYVRGIRPSRITLGSFRMLTPLKHIIAKRFPESPLLAQPLEKHGKRLRYRQEVREGMYAHAIASVRAHDKSVPIALCKESPELHEVFKGQVDRTRCNCQV